MEEETYRAERNQLLEYLLNQAGFFDRGILTLSAAALGLSLTFTKDVAPNHTPESLWMLHWAWGFFIASLLATLTSFQTSQSAIHQAIDNLDKVYEKLVTSDKIRNPWGKLTSVINWVSLATFIAGVTLLTGFAIAKFA